MAKAVKRGDKWRIQIYCGKDENGKPIRKSITAKTESAAYKAERAWLRAGGIVEARQQEKRGPTLSQAIDAYVSRCENSVTKPYSPATLRMYNSVSKTFEPYKDIYVEDLTIEDIQDYIDWRALTCVRKTIKNDLYVLKPALDLCKRRDLDFRDLELPDQEREDYIIPTDQQIQAMLRHFSQDDDMVIAIVLGAFCGLRRSEICGLEWGDVDRGSCTIRIERAVVFSQDSVYVTKGTKSRAGKRTISISAETLATLTRRARIGDRLYKSTDRIVSITPHLISSRFARAARELGFDFTFHSLRHYHASIMLALNVPKAYIVENMGHSDYTMVERVYGQIVREKEMAMARIVGSHADTIIRGERFGWADEQNPANTNQ